MTLLASAGADTLSRHVGWSRFGAPPDAIAWAALLGALAIALSFPRFVATQGARRVVVAAAAFVAAALSGGYVAAFLRGGPRIVDATTYFLEARAIAGGRLAWNAGEPGASVAGRFLVRNALGDGALVAGIFPPGYPAWLAIFVKLGMPMAGGPVLAALLVLATAWLAREVARRLEPGASSAEAKVQLALLPVGSAALSAVCAALRYHTADTMSHGLAALAATVALAAALRAVGDPRVAPRLVMGAALGLLFATRPVSAVVIAAVVAAVLATGGSGGTGGQVAARRLHGVARTAGVMALGAAPGIALFFAHQRAATGTWLVSSQSLYYALSDGPAGCFRYGFGAGIGCENEHGTFVAANLSAGFGPYAALGTSLRRLKAHLVDPLSSEPAFALVLVGLSAAIRGPRAIGLVALAPIALLVGYAPFYFDGNFPGGGARLLADTLPVEHVLAALGALAIARRFKLTRLTSPPRALGFAIALALAGFAFRASYDHRLLRDREGGVPMFEPSVVAAAGITRGLVFVETDHGFAIGHDPGIHAGHGVEVIRRRGDSLDRIAWISRGSPPAFAYSLSTLHDGERAVATVTPFEPPPAGRVEGESLWPSLLQEGAYAMPRPARGTCASRGAWLGIVAPSGQGVVELELPRSLHGIRFVPRVARAEGVTVDVEIPRGSSAEAPGRATPATAAEAWSCVDLLPIEVPPGGDAAPRLRLRVEAAGPPGDPREPIAALDVLILNASPY